MGFFEHCVFSLLALLCEAFLGTDLFYLNLFRAFAISSLYTRIILIGQGIHWFFHLITHRSFRRSDLFLFNSNGFLFYLFTILRIFISISSQPGSGVFESFRLKHRPFGVLALAHARKTYFTGGTVFLIVFSSLHSPLCILDCDHFGPFRDLVFWSSAELRVVQTMF